MRSYRELLATAAVLTALVALGAAVTAQRGAAWQNAVCRDSLKKLHRAAMAYQSDHHDFFQPVIVRTNPWTYWNEFLRPYDGDPKTYGCPANPRTKTVYEDDDLLPPLYSMASIGFGMNFFLSSSGEAYQKSWPANLKRIASPAYTIYFGDARKLVLRPTRGCWESDSADYHEGAANYVFIDGHVERMDRSNLGLYQPIDGWTVDQKRWRNWK